MYFDFQEKREEKKRHSADVGDRETNKLLYISFIVSPINLFFYFFWVGAAINSLLGRIICGWIIIAIELKESILAVSEFLIVMYSMLGMCYKYLAT